MNEEKERSRKSERQTQRGSVRDRKKQRERAKTKRTLKGTQKELGEWGHRNFERQKQTHTIRMKKRGEMEKGRKKN